MANEYLVEIHEYISEKIVRANSRKAEADANNDQGLQRFYEGQLAEWHRMRAHLTERVDLKTQKYY